MEYNGEKQELFKIQKERRSVSKLWRGKQRENASKQRYSFLGDEIKVGKNENRYKK